MSLAFVKMHGIGNDFVVLDGVGSSLPDLDWPSLSRRANDRRGGVGGDGLILAERGTDAPFRMRMFNPDGSEAEMCGNGIRCLARLLVDRGYVTEGAAEIETGAGPLSIAFEGEDVRVDMGRAELRPDRIPVVADGETFVARPVGHGLVGTAVSMGNPHLVVFTPEVAAVELERMGPLLERDPLFPARINVHFAQLLSRSEIRMRTWERGAGITLACGTGACAVGVAAYLNGLAECETLIHLPGGSLRIAYAPPENGGDRTVLMTGPATTVFSGTIEV